MLAQDSRGRFVQQVEESEVSLWQSEYLLGLTYKQIANKYSRSVHTIHRYICIGIDSRAWGGTWKPRSVRDLTNLEFAYLAGLIDGEGCLQTYITVRSSGKSCHSTRITVYNTDQDMLNWLTGLGGHFRWKKLSGIGTKPCGSWDIHSLSDVLYVLKGTLPFLTAKKPKALVMLSVLEERLVALEGVHNEATN